uniref:Period circadian clock 3 n=1 Tax=Salmo trutta TaxID=8032 RepID=A0A673WBG2_SALTR
MLMTVAEMKKIVPSDKCSRSKASTIEALHYALNCVKQVQANSEYYKLLLRNSQEERPDATSCTLEELKRVTSEHTFKNTNSFLVVFSLVSGRVMYASEQAPSILCCKKKFLDSAKFCVTPILSCLSTAAVLFECAQVKSFFCRIRGGKDHEGELLYNPFKITPYLLKVQGDEALGEEEESCCLALAERIISGYEAPRISMDKRIFTTTHSPGCVFLKVDNRAVPLLGYLPQDLIGTSLLTCIYPKDRPIMLSMHCKVLKYAGQSSFEHSPVRFRCQNGDYVTLDTSWSSYIDPWSRKVAFIIGRHKVRTGPLNEDVFAAWSKEDLPIIHEEIKNLQAKIYKLFLQPVHNNGSSGYGSLGSNGSHENYISVDSSSDSNGNLLEDSHREPQICADVKSWCQHVYLESSHILTPFGKSATAPLPHVRAEVRGHEETRKQTHIPSYQQINSVDSIIRYLEGCGPHLKRKSKSRSIGTSSSSSSTSEDDTPTTDPHTAQASSDVVVLDNQVSVGSTAAAMVRAPLTDITLSVYKGYECSVSHQPIIFFMPCPPEVTALEDAPMGSKPADHTPARAAPSPTPSSSAEELQLVGLTKEVLSAHTQKEEQEYVDQFRHRILHSPSSTNLHQDNRSGGHSHHPGVWKPNKHKRPKPKTSSDSYASPPEPSLALPRPSSESSNPLPQFGLPHPPISPPKAPMGTLQTPYFTMLRSQPGVHQGLNPYIAPMMAVILPNYPSYPSGYPTMYHPTTPSLLPQAPFIMSGFGPGLGPFTQPQPSSQPQTPPGQLHCSPRPSSSVGEEVAGPPALFSNSRSSSPLQLNLLQEELPKPSESQSSTGRTHSRAEILHDAHTKGIDAPCESGNHDAQATSSELLDLLLQEDGSLGTGSNVSGSGFGVAGSLSSGSNGASTSHTGSSNSSKYFASNDSSDTFRKASKNQEAQQDHAQLTQHAFNMRVENSLWRIIQHMPEPVKMTYQIHPKDQAEVLAKDKEQLRLLQPLQPWFTQEQREELAEVHPWIQQHTVPQMIDTQVGRAHIHTQTHRFRCMLTLSLPLCLHVSHSLSLSVYFSLALCVSLSLSLCVSQGCVNCSARTGIHPQGPESSSPLECPQQESSPAPDT